MDTFYERNGIRIIHADFLAVAQVGRESVDLTVTSPPYGLDVRYQDYKDDISYETYLQFSREWLGQCYRLTRPTGRLCLNICLDKNKGGAQAVYADLVQLAKGVGFGYQTSIVWNEQNISRRTAWGSFCSASAPWVIAPVEMVAIFYKGAWKREGGSRVSDLAKEEFIPWTNGVWTFSGEKKKAAGHPSPFPLELAARCIKLFSFVGDTVMDPMMGSGTTLVAAQRLKRKAVGVEVSEEYCQRAVQRLEAEALAGMAAPDEHVKEAGVENHDHKM